MLPPKYSFYLKDKSSLFWCQMYSVGLSIQIKDTHIPYSKVVRKSHKSRHFPNTFAKPYVEHAKVRTFLYRPLLLSANP